MNAVDAPVFLDQQIALEVQQEIVRGHQAAGEEMAAHPVVLAPGLDCIRVLAVRENMDEQPAPGLQPLANPAHQQLVVAHVLEHLHGHNAVEPAVRAEVVHVRGNRFHVLQPPRLLLGLDELPLGRRAGHGQDPRLRKALGHPERKRAPSAPQIENLHAVGKPGAPAHQVQHRFLRRVERVNARRPEAAAVLQPAAEHLPKKRRGQRIALLVPALGVNRDRALA